MTPISIGPIVVPTSGTPVRLEVSSRRCRRIVVQPLTSNSGAIYVGLSDMNFHTNVGVLERLSDKQLGPFLSADGKRFKSAEATTIVGARASATDDLADMFSPVLPSGRCGLDWFDLDLSSDATSGSHSCFVVLVDSALGDISRFRIRPGERIQSPTGWSWVSSAPGATLSIILRDEAGDPLSLTSGGICFNAGGSDQLVPCQEYEQFDTGIVATSFFDTSTFFIDAEISGDGVGVVAWTP